MKNFMYVIIFISLLDLCQAQTNNTRVDKRKTHETMD